MKLNEIASAAMSVEPMDDNPTDTIALDVPLFIRLMEYAREDAKTDMDLHNVAENAIDMSSEGKLLSMQDYESIISKGH